MTISENRQLPVYSEYDAWEYSSGIFSPVSVRVSMEYSLTLSINGNHYLSVACSGSDLRELAVGHLASEGIIQSEDEIENIEIDYDTPLVNIVTRESDYMTEKLFRLRSIPSGCGSHAMVMEYTKGYVRSRMQLNAENILPLMREFLNYSEHHKMTRGVHSAGLYTSTGERLSFFDEIGRHNAVDKVIGDAFLRKIPLNDKILASTGRISGEITVKALSSNIPVIISRSQPTSITIELARKYGLIIIGRIRASSFTAFHGRESFEL